MAALRWIKIHYKWIDHRAAPFCVMRSFARPALSKLGIVRLKSALVRPGKIYDNSVYGHEFTKNRSMRL